MPGAGPGALPEQFGPVPTQTVDWANLAGDANLWLLGLVFLFYAPLEGSFSVWTTTYLTEPGRESGRGGVDAVGLLGGVPGVAPADGGAVALGGGPVGRAVAPCRRGRLHAAVVGDLVGTANRSSASFSLVLLGFLLGPVFPMLVSLAFRAEPAAPGTAYGALFAAGSAGGLLMTPLVGAHYQRSDVQTALRIPMVLAVAMSAAALVYALTRIGTATTSRERERADFV